MRGEARVRALLRVLHHYASFFLLVAFVITCCTMLFVTVLSRTLGVELTTENLGAAAKITFLNVVLISLLFTVIDAVRRELTVTRPVRRIAEATERMIAGDFDVRLSPVSRIVADGKLNDVISCINHMARELSSVETLRTDFVANVSHEMKTPLAVIQNYARLLQSPALDSAARTEYARAVSDAAARLADMITNVLRLSRLENQQIYSKKETFDLGEQLSECLLQYESVWEESGIDIEVDLKESVTVVADRELLSHVWSNLFSNAFKFTERGGRVTLTLTADASFAAVTVADTGCGIPPEVGAHMFEKFYQGDTSHATRGNGLGLALVKRVVDIIGGEITVKSTVGKGSSFTVRLPVAGDGEADDL